MKSEQTCKQEKACRAFERVDIKIVQFVNLTISTCVIIPEAAGLDAETKSCPVMERSGGWGGEGIAFNNNIAKTVRDNKQQESTCYSSQNGPF